MRQRASRNDGDARLPVPVRSVKVLDRFASDHAPCMYVRGIVEVCPYDTLFWSPEFDVLEHDMGNLIHEKECLEVSPCTVLPPPEIEDREKSAGETWQKRHGSVGGSLRAGDD